jgi:hypothetical protein
MISGLHLGGTNQSMCCQGERPSTVLRLRCTQLSAPLLLALLLVLQLSVAQAEDCATDEDCKPIVCCGGTACAPTEQAPSSCSGVTCGCEPFTLDCGGKCICSATKKCAALLNQNTGGAGSSPISDGGGGGDASSGRRRRRKPSG